MRIATTAQHTSAPLSRRTLLAAAIAGLVLIAPRLDAEVVTYRLDVDNTWSTSSHPGLFPGAAHFSWLGGGTHNDQISFWNECVGFCGSYK